MRGKLLQACGQKDLQASKTRMRHVKGAREAAVSDGFSNSNSYLIEKPLDELSLQDQEMVFNLGLMKNMRLHKFKKNMELPRVKRVLGILKQLQPENHLDIGSGRGVFLWPLLDSFADLQITCIDIRCDRIDDLKAVKEGGVTRLDARLMDAASLEFADESFDTVSILEVLEHMPNAQAALSEAARVAKRAVLISVPSHEDDNPEHIHFLDRPGLNNMLEKTELKARFEFVLNHTIVLALKEHA